MNNAESTSLNLRFYNTPAGELVCRVTDAFTHESWMAPDAPGLLHAARGDRRETPRAADSQVPGG